MIIPVETVNTMFCRNNVPSYNRIVNNIKIKIIWQREINATYSNITTYYAYTYNIFIIILFLEPVIFRPPPTELLSSSKLQKRSCHHHVLIIKHKNQDSCYCFHFDVPTLNHNIVYYCSCCLRRCFSSRAFMILTTSIVSASPLGLY